jgi:hypothetical protein
MRLRSPGRAGYLTDRALTRDGVSLRGSSRATSGPPETPVEALATVSRRHVTSPSTHACSAGVKVAHTRPGSIASVPCRVFAAGRRCICLIYSRGQSRRFLW